METGNNKSITVQVTVSVPVDKAWELWTTPLHITKWNNASDDWHTPRAENDLRTGGKFLSRMEAKDGSAGFDFEGTYTKVKKHEQIEYTLEDGRKVVINFTGGGNATIITETFETENVYSAEQQRSGWQSILNNFKKYSEANAG